MSTTMRSGHESLSEGGAQLPTTLEQASMMLREAITAIREADTASAAAFESFNDAVKKMRDEGVNVGFPSASQWIEAAWKEWNRARISGDGLPSFMGKPL